MEAGARALRVRVAFALRTSELQGAGLQYLHLPGALRGHLLALGEVVLVDAIVAETVALARIGRCAPKPVPGVRAHAVVRRGWSGRVRARAAGELGRIGLEHLHLAGTLGFHGLALGLNLRFGEPEVGARRARTRGSVRGVLTTPAANERDCGEGEESRSGFHRLASRTPTRIRLVSPAKWGLATADFVEQRSRRGNPERGVYLGRGHVPALYVSGLRYYFLAMSLRIECAHDLGIEDARERIRAWGEYLSNKHGIGIEWIGDDEVKVAGKFMVVTIDATVKVEAKRVRFEGKDPGMLWRGKAKEYLERKMAMYLDPDRPLSDLPRR